MADAEYAILGAVTVRCAPGASPIALSEQHKVLLARLLLEPGARVGPDALIEALWDGSPGRNPRNAVQVAVSALRGLLGDTGRRAIITEGNAYRIVVDDPLRIDAERFRRLALRGHDLVEHRPHAARAMLTEAFSLWRGPLFGELGERVWAAGHTRELDSVRDRAEIDLNEVRLALGDHAALEGALRLQIARTPYDERRRGQFIRVLDRAGRSAEAQLAYREAYEELGAFGPELRRIGEEIARPGAAGTAPRPRGGLALYGGGRPDGILLCAALDPRGRSSDEAGLGMLSLLIDGHGGDAYPATDDLIVALFGDVDSALASAAAIARQGSTPASVGVHIGGIVRVGDTLAGPGPARCAQLARAAHPGQALLTAAVRSRASSASELRDLGEQRFFDLGAGEPVFELPTRRGEAFPPPATLSRLAHNLPVQTTRFVGREEELATLSRIVAGGELVTLTGAGGCGKTRLALQLAAAQVQAFADGAWFVELAEVGPEADAETVASVCVHQLRARALTGETHLDALARHLGERQALVVIDNCEQVHRACAELLAALGQACRGVCFVVTTRRPLRIDGERVLSVSSMAVDPVSAHGLPSDAVQLLLDRAGPLPSSPQTDEEPLECALRICRALDGLPLAVELAAAQIPVRGLEGVAAEVEAMMRGEHGLAQFASDDPRRADRQRTIESAMQWSYRLLGDEDQRVLRRLAVFHGTFGVAEAQRAAEVGPDDDHVLQTLIDCSMVAAAPPLDGVSRLRLMQPIRAFARSLLTRAGELPRAREMHAAVFLGLAVDAAPRLFGPDEQACLQRLEAEHDNLRAALAWHVEHRRSSEALRLVGALWWLWFSHGHLAEGCAWVQRALDLDDEPGQERVRALRAGSHLAWWRGDHVQCDAYNVALDECARAIGDEWGLAWVAMGFGATEIFRDPARVLPMFEESKRRFDALGRRWEAGYTLHLIGGARWFGGDEKAAGEAFEQAVEIFDGLGHRSVLASVERCAGLMAARCGSPARGAAMCRHALSLSDAIGDRAGSAQALNYLAAISRDENEHQTAVSRYAEALELAREVGDLWATCWAVDGLAGAARRFGERELAARLLAQSAQLAARSWYDVPSPHERRLRDEDVAALREALGAAEFERAAAEGGRMSVGDVVSCALAFAARVR